MTLEERFWKHIAMPDGCWEWQGARANGYGKIQAEGKLLSAHRVSWEIHFGPIPEGMFVCHRCDNPSCVRPDHLFLGKPMDNSHDMKTKKRNWRQGHHTGHLRGSAHLKTKMTDEDILFIRATYKPGVTTYQALADKYGVTKQAIRAIVIGQSWRHLLPHLE